MKLKLFTFLHQRLEARELAAWQTRAYCHHRFWICKGEMILNMFWDDKDILKYLNTLICVIGYFCVEGNYWQNLDTVWHPRVPRPRDNTVKGELELVICATKLLYIVLYNVLSISLCLSSSLIINRGKYLVQQCMQGRLSGKLRRSDTQALKYRPSSAGIQRLDFIICYTTCRIELRKYCC